MIRDAERDHVAAITAIYNQVVADTTAIWNERIVDEADRLAWLADRHDHGYPVLVAVAADAEIERAGTVLGYATFGPFRPHEGYRHTAELSVHVRDDQRGRGVGSALMAELIARARALGLHVLVAAVEADNAASIRLHRKMGFVSAGVMPQVGAKFGRWLDLNLLVLRLDDAPAPPTRGMR